MAAGPEQRCVDDRTIIAYRDLDPKTILYDRRSTLDGSQDGGILGGIHPTPAAGPDGTTIFSPCELEEAHTPSLIINYLD